MGTLSFLLIRHASFFAKPNEKQTILEEARARYRLSIISVLHHLPHLKLLKLIGQLLQMGTSL